MNSRKRCAPQQQQKRKRGIQIQYPANRAYGMNGNYYHFGKKNIAKDSQSKSSIGRANKIEVRDGGELYSSNIIV